MNEDVLKIYKLVKFYENNELYNNERRVAYTVLRGAIETLFPCTIQSCLDVSPLESTDPQTIKRSF